MAFEKLTAEELGERLRASGTRGIALDIDDTLSLTGLQWFDWMLAHCGNPENLTCEQAMRKYLELRSVPYWQNEEAEAKIQEFFRSSLFHDQLALVEGADDAIREIAGIVPIVAYITARPADVHESTRNWFVRHGFPEAPIVYRPGGTDTERNKWKASVLMDTYPEISGIIDDHPHLAQELARIGYPGTLYLYDHGNNANVYVESDAHRSWEEIIGRLKADFAS